MEAAEEAALAANRAALEPWRTSYGEEPVVYLAHTDRGPLASLEGIPMEQPARVVTAPGHAITHVYRAPFARSSELVQLRAAIHRAESQRDEHQEECDRRKQAHADKQICIHGSSPVETDA